MKCLMLLLVRSNQSETWFWEVGTNDKYKCLPLTPPLTLMPQKLAEKKLQWGQLRIPDPNYAIACWPVLGPRTPFSSTLNHFVKKCDPPFFWQWKCGKSNLPAPLSIMSVGTKTIKCYQLQLQRSPCLHPASLSTDTGAEFSQPRTIQFYNINPWIKINKSMLKL